MKSNALDVIRHSTAHILATAVLEMFPEAKFGTGPAIENGFYYDFDLPRTLIPEDLPLLEEKMKAIIKANYKFECAKISASEAMTDFEKLGQTYKLELIDELEKNKQTISVYKSGGFVDLCSGPHLNSTGEVNQDAFKLTKISGAYWKADEKNKQMQRIYGVVFESKKDLDKYLAMIMEAEKRDHRKLGKELGLFIFSDLIGPGLPLYTDKGATIRREIIKYSNELQSAIGYKEVCTPNMNKAELFKISGHYEKYKEDMFRVVSNYTKDEYYLKPMNCPQHTQIYASQKRSYKDLPIRIADFSNLYRDEKPGELSGLTRLRCFCQDDGHCFCREDQIKEEFVAVLNAIEKAMATYGMEYKIRLSLWDQNNPEKYLGDAEVWKKSQILLEEILIENKVDYTRVEGEAAIYGPKMDLISHDSLGRKWQVSTIQLDFIMPQRFGLTYIDADGKEKIPVMIHRAIVGSPERFLGILLEHYAGVFPLWLSPVQVKILPVGEGHLEYCKKLSSEFEANGIRVEVNISNETIGNKIRKAIGEKVPYIIIVGDREMESGRLSVRDRNNKTNVLDKSDFILKVEQEIRNRV